MGLVIAGIVLIVAAMIAAAVNMYGIFTGGFNKGNIAVHLGAAVIGVIGAALLVLGIILLVV